MAAKDTLKSDIADMCSAMIDMSEGGDDYFAENLSAAIDKYVKSLGIAAGSVVVSVTGNAAGVTNVTPIQLSG